MRITITNEMSIGLVKIAAKFETGLMKPAEIVMLLIKRELGNSAPVVVAPKHNPMLDDAPNPNPMLGDTHKSVAPKHNPMLDDAPKEEPYSRFTGKNEAYLIEQARYYIAKGDYTDAGRRINEDICIALDELDTWEIDLRPMQSKLDPVNYPPAVVEETATGVVM